MKGILYLRMPTEFLQYFLRFSLELGKIQYGMCSQKMYCVVVGSVNIVTAKAIGYIRPLMIFCL